MPRTGAPDQNPAHSARIALVLQGGGALGSYQAGVYEAMSEHGLLPDWIAGISIGAINGAIIAGNAPDRRVERLQAFWNEITRPSSAFPLPGHTPAGDRLWHAFAALMRGQPGFFLPRPWQDWLGATPVSFYDTAALRSTLERLVDFDQINAGETRLSIGAANVRTGDFAYFDSRETRIGVEHVMASAALPPAFPPVEIAGEHYWDGGLVSNTPLQYVLDYVPRRSRLIFQVDLFNAVGRLPSDLDSALEREKDIRYSSRSRTATDTYRVIHDVRHNINSLLEKLPPALRQSREARFLYEFGCVTRMDIAQLAYHPVEPQGQAKDYEFSRESMAARWQQGLHDARTMIEAAPWRVPMPDNLGARVFELVARASRHAQQSLLREPAAPSATNVVGADP